MKKLQFRPYQGILINDNNPIKVNDEIDNLKQTINIFNNSYALYPTNNLLTLSFLDKNRIETIDQAYAKLNLKNIILKDVTTIFTNCFYAPNEYNPNIIDLTNCPNLTTISNGAFFNCNAATYKLGNLTKLTSIGNGCFLGVSAKLDFSKADKLTSIGVTVFGSVLVEPKKAIWLKFGNNISNITFASNSFKDCDQHSAIEVPKSLLESATAKLTAAGFNGFISGYDD